MTMDHYEVLEVERTATKDQIKRAYRKKAKAAHPDAGGDSEEFKLISLAHDILTDEEMRGRYDRGESLDKKPQLTQIVEGLAMEAFQNGTNPMSYMRAKARKEISGIKASMEQNDITRKKLEAKLEKLKSANTKTKNKEGLEFLVGTINRFIEVGKSANVGLDASITLWEDVLTFIAHIEFPEEQIQPFSRPSGMWTTVTF